MEKEFYDFLFELRASGFRHTTADDLIHYFSDFKTGAKSFSKDFDLTDSKISSNGERGFLSGYKLNDIRNFIIGCCFLHPIPSLKKAWMPSMPMDFPITI